MDKIVIYNAARTQSLEMPRTRAIAVGGEELCEETQMASGKLVKDVRGFRLTITAEWEWFPADKMTALHGLLRTGGYFYVAYPDVTGQDAAGMFAIGYPEAKVFRFVDGAPMWYGVQLTFTAQEVI